jgi:hypothetical protein
MKPLAPDLFQRRFQNFVDIGHARIPALAPEWTDHNAHDPGIMLMELLAWVAEAQLYSLSRQRRDERSAYAELLGVSASGTQAAQGLIWNDPTDPNSPSLKFDHSVVIPTDTVINVLNDATPTFRPTQKLLWIPGQISRLEARLADGSVADLTSTNQRGGIPFLPFGETAGPKDTLRLTFVARGDSGLFGKNRKDVNGALWAIGVRSAPAAASSADLPSVDASGADPAGGTAQCCHSSLTASLLVDGQRVPLAIPYDSTNGMLNTGALLVSLDNIPGSPQECTIEFRAPGGFSRPPQLLRIEPSVIPIEQGKPISAERQTSYGMPDWSLTLSEPGLKFKSGQPPLKLVVEGDATAWDLRDDLSQCGPDDRVYELDAAKGVITFGNGVNGKIPAVNSDVLVSYAVCDGAEGNIARNRRWNVFGFESAFGVNIDPVTGGAAGTALLDQRGEARRRSREEHGLISADDIVKAAIALPLLDVARAWLVPPDKKLKRTGTVTLVAMRRRASWVEPEHVPETRRWLDAILNRLRARMPLGTRLAVVAPEYVPFSIHVTLEAEAGRDPAVVKQQVQKRLSERLVLVDRGDGNPARQPGLPVSLRDVAAWSKLVDGVARVMDLQLLSATGKPLKEVLVSSSGLPRYDSRNSTIDAARPGQGGAA